MCPVTQLVRELEAAPALSQKASPQASLSPGALGSEEGLFMALSLPSLPFGPKEMTKQRGTAQLRSAELVRKELLPPSEHLGKNTHTALGSLSLALLLSLRLLEDASRILKPGQESSGSYFFLPNTQILATVPTNLHMSFRGRVSCGKRTWS